MNHPLDAPLMNAETSATIDELTSGARALALETAHSLRASALAARDSTARFIQERPLPAMLIAAGAGMALMLIAGMLLRDSGHRR
jgi:hypothetical protein